MNHNKEVRERLQKVGLDPDRDYLKEYLKKMKQRSPSFIGNVNVSVGKGGRIMVDGEDVTKEYYGDGNMNSKWNKMMDAEIERKLDNIDSAVSKAMKKMEQALSHNENEMTSSFNDIQERVARRVADIKNAVPERHTPPPAVEYVPPRPSFPENVSIGPPTFSTIMREAFVVPVVAAFKLAKSILTRKSKQVIQSGNQSVGLQVEGDLSIDGEKITISEPKKAKGRNVLLDDDLLSD